MSTLSVIRTAIKSILESNIPGIITYDTAPDVTQIPCVVVIPRNADYVVGMGSCVQWTFDLYVLVARGPIDSSQNALDVYLDGSGPRSIQEIIKSNPDLGLGDVNAVITGMSEYGGQYRAAQVEHMGAQLALKVLATN